MISQVYLTLKIPVTVRMMLIRHKYLPSRDHKQEPVDRENGLEQEWRVCRELRAKD